MSSFPFCGIWHLFHMCGFTCFACALFSPIYFYAMSWKIGALLCSTICLSIGIQFYDILCVLAFTDMAYNVVDHVLPVVFHIPLEAFQVVAIGVVINFVSCFCNTISTPFLSITNAYGKICRWIFSRQPSGYSDWCEGLAPVFRRFYLWMLCKQWQWAVRIYCVWYALFIYCLGFCGGWEDEVWVCF